MLNHFERKNYSIYLITDLNACIAGMLISSITIVEDELERQILPVGFMA
jgi:hypothetical protein